jgi:hypothetical protein
MLDRCSTTWVSPPAQSIVLNIKNNKWLYPDNIHTLTIIPAFISIFTEHLCTKCCNWLLEYNIEFSGFLLLHYRQFSYFYSMKVFQSTISTNIYKNKSLARRRKCLHRFNITSLNAILNLLARPSKWVATNLIGFTIFLSNIMIRYVSYRNHSGKSLHVYMVRPYYKL